MVDKLELLFVEIPGSLLGGLEFSAGLNFLDNYAWPRFDHKGENIFQSGFPIYHELKLSIFGRPDNACQNLLNVLFIGIGQGCIVCVYVSDFNWSSIEFGKSQFCRLVESKS